MDKKTIIFIISSICIFILLSFLIKLAIAKIELNNAKKLLINKIKEKDKEKAMIYDKLLEVKEIKTFDKFSIVTYQLLNNTFRLITLTDKLTKL